MVSDYFKKKKQFILYFKSYFTKKLKKMGCNYFNVLFI